MNRWTCRQTERRSKRLKDEQGDGKQINGRKDFDQETDIQTDV